MMKSKRKSSLRPVADFFSTQDDVQLGIVFGSLAAGSARPDSDLDVAVLADRPLSASRRVELIEDLARLVGRPVDLVDLSLTSAPITRSAMLTGKVVFARDQRVYPDLLTRMLIDSADFLPYRERLLKQRREAWLG